jgi:hypothetical protein
MIKAVNKPFIEVPKGESSDSSLGKYFTATSSMK